MDNDIIRIAEAMGWKEHHGIGNYPRTWRLPYFGYSWREAQEHDLPNPKTSHADCHALIEWLRAEKGLQVAVLYHEGEDIVQFIEPGTGKAATDAYEGKDYRLGVVELTLKLLGQNDG